MKHIIATLCALLGTLLCLAGCALSPKYGQPKSPAPPTWRPGEANASDQLTAGAPLAAELKWADFFSDDNLRQIIEMALRNNRDLRMAALNVEKVQALFRIQRAEQFPTVNASATGDLYRLPRTATIGGFSVSEATTVKQYTVGGVASWELDLFGRVRSLKSQALEQYLATEQARSASQISLVAAVAVTYLTMGADRDNLRIAQATIQAQQASYELIKHSRDMGIATDLDLQQAQSQVEAASVDIARYSGQLELDENALNLLVGSPVSASLLPRELGLDQTLKEISVGLPSTVLLRRPDVLMAEHELKAAYANIGVARAAFLPRIALTGGGGLMSGELKNLFKGASGTWNFTPQLDLPIFDAGARKASLRAAQVDRDVAIADYEKAIQIAFREVSDSLSQRNWLTAQENSQQALVNTLEKTYRLAELRYKAGIDNYLSVLVAQRSLYASQQALVGIRVARLGNLVTLYKVLGGGA
jgi:outer membrane protein, multidrug efflux system